jgi:putative transposase
MKCEAIYLNRKGFTIREMCSALGLHKSTYYNWLKNHGKRQIRQLEKTKIAEQVRTVFVENKRVYGYRKMQRALKGNGIVLSVYRIRKIMRETGLYPETQKKFKPYPNKKSDGKYSDNTLKQQFGVKEPNTVWAGDITYIKSKLGWVLAIVKDLFNREIIGWSVSKVINTEFIKRALGNACTRADDTRGIIFHSDRGVQYSSNTYSQMLQEHSIIPSMSRAGCPYDNSCVEGFFASLKKECIYKRKYDTMEEIERDLFEYIELFYNRKRLHATLGYLSPVEYRIQVIGGEVA